MTAPPAPTTICRLRPADPYASLRFVFALPILRGVVPSMLFGGALRLVTVALVAWRWPAPRRLARLAPEGADGDTHTA